MSTCNSGLAGEIIAFTYPALLKISDNQVIPRVQGGNRCILDVKTNPNKAAQPNAIVNTSDGNGNVTSLQIGQQGAGAQICGPLIIQGQAINDKLLEVINGDIIAGGSLHANDMCGTNTINGTTNVETLNVSCALTVTGCTTLNGGLNVAGGTSTFAGCATFNGGVKIASGNLLVCGSINSTNDITAFFSSDKRLKNNIIKISDSNDIINNINGYEFDWNEKTDKNGHDYGVIAQEVEKVAPTLVKKRDDGYLSVDYIKLIPILIEEVKSLNNRIKVLEGK